MPFLGDDAQPISLANRIDIPKGFAVTPGAEDLEDGADKPMWNWQASMRRQNILGGWAGKGDSGTLFVGPDGITRRKP